MQYAYTDQEQIDFGSLMFKPFSRIEGIGDSRLADAGLVSTSRFTRKIMQFCCAPSDLLYYNDSNDPTNVDVPHRYFHPPATNGVEVMLKVPKVIITAPYDATAGEAMCVTWFFWTSWQHLAVLGATASSTAHELMGSLATEVVQTYEPIPDDPWEVPVLAPLPGDFTLLSGPERIKALLRRA